METAENNYCPIIDHTSLRFVAVLVAAGKGTRAEGDLPKQYRSFLGDPVFIRSIPAFYNHDQNVGVVIVHPSGDSDRIKQYLQASGFIDDERIVLTEGGKNRTDSVKKGIEQSKSFNANSVLVHDAARPGLRLEDVTSLLKELERYEGAAPGLPVTDSLKHQSEQGIRSVSRENLYRIQTPQAFRAEVIYDLVEDIKESATDEFTLAEQAKRLVTLTGGHERLSKLTYPDDFKNLESILSNSETRVGLGYDVHAFENGDNVTLCGVDIPHIAKLKGHSDADVAWHALTDAILGAISAGDIGDHFPPSDPQWKGAPSSVFLTEAKRLVRDQKGEIINVDITLICEAPKVNPHRTAMIRSTAEVLGIDASRVSIKATTTERLGFEGRREGIAAQAVANIRLFSRQSDETA